MNPVELSIFASRIAAICEEMGAVLRRAAFSPNIKDRLDYSCAVFDHSGELCAQAAHIPVHLGSMAYAMRDIVNALDWRPGDVAVVNDPFLGGTHLPDVTVITPFFWQGELAGFAANRAHHANIGADSPGSMPVSRSLAEEGVIIPPTRLVSQGHLDEALLRTLTGTGTAARQARGDYLAQLSANRSALQRLQELLADLTQARGGDFFQAALGELNAYAERMARQALAQLPPGEYTFKDYMDDDGAGTERVPIVARVTVGAAGVDVDFSGTAAQVPGNINCPLAVAAAAVFYVFRCLMPAATPACAGAFRPIRLHAEPGSLVNARRPAAVAAGNVETSSRIVDVVLGALAQALPDLVPAASQGSMNNLALGVRSGADAWDYYETLGGGMGAGARGGGLHAVHSHMTNTLNTPIEVLESRFPLRVCRYAIRHGSGGAGLRPGGDGLIREYQCLARMQASLLTERRSIAPWGLAGGGAGAVGVNRLNGTRLPAKVQLQLQAGDRLMIATPGGGAWGRLPD